MLSQRRLQKLITYNPKTGEVSGGSISLYGKGFLRIYLKGKHYPLTKIVWQYSYGDLNDKDYIGFKNGDRLDMRLDNLYIKTNKVKFEDGKYITE